MWRPAPGETIKTDSPTQDSTHKKARLLGSPTNDLLYCPNLTVATDEWKPDIVPTRHGAVAVGKFPLNSSTTSPAHNTSPKSRHDAFSCLSSFRPAPAHDCGSVCGTPFSATSGRNDVLGFNCEPDRTSFVISAWYSLTNYYLQKPGNPSVYISTLVSNRYHCQLEQQTSQHLHLSPV